MAVDQSKILSMLEGRTLEKGNIEKMARMVESASDVEDKKKVMKHSVFFPGAAAAHCRHPGGSGGDQKDSLQQCAL